MKTVLGTASLIALAAPTFAGTYVVDDDGGAGVDFLDIGPAIAATAPGDVLLVRAGTYSAFVLDKAERLIGDGSGVVTVIYTAQHFEVQVKSIPAGAVAAITGMHFAAGWTIADSTGLVVGDDLFVGSPTSIAHCTDVRLMRCNLYGVGDLVDGYGVGIPALTIDHARVELVESHAIGGNGHSCSGCMGSAGGSGSDGASLLDGAKLHAARTSLHGGIGGSITGWDTYGTGGRGGNGVSLAGSALEPASTLLTGQASDSIDGAAGGYGESDDGTDGSSLAASGVNDHVRISGVTATYFANPHIETPVPDDPSMSLVGIPTAGQLMTFRISGPVGAHAELLLGRTAQIVATSGTNEDLLVVPLRTKNLGFIDSMGTVSVNIPLPLGTPKGQKYFAQARVVYADSTAHYTNSTPILAR